MTAQPMTAPAVTHDAPASGAQRPDLRVTNTSIFCATPATQIDLASLRGSDIDLVAMGEQLAKIPRYNGATPGVVWPVASHLVLCGRMAAQWFPEHGPMLALHCLLHDAHEAILGDRPRPVERWLAKNRTGYMYAPADIARGGPWFWTCDPALGDAAEWIDALICGVVGITPPQGDTAKLVAHIDNLAIVAEWRQLMPHLPPDAHGLTAHGGDVPLDLPRAIWRLRPPASWHIAVI
jgi:hypothetical protein